MNLNGIKYNYLPILSISPSEMKAIEELPEKDKDCLLPLFPLKGWASSKTLEKSLERVERAFASRPWIADIDSDFLMRARTEIVIKDEPRPVFNQIVELADPSNGYDNWCRFIAHNENLVPCIQIEELSEVSAQVNSLRDLGKTLAIYLKLYELNTRQLSIILETLSSCSLENELFIIDFGDIDQGYQAELAAYGSIVTRISTQFSSCDVAVAATSFPYSFSGQRRGEASIYERQLHQSINNAFESKSIIYSDHGSTRAGKMSGGSGTPPPRIDYALKLEWKFIREEFEDSRDIQEGEKHGLYKQIANEMIIQDYWIDDLKLWGTQMIELTAQGNSYGITSAQDSTSVRINLHLYQQLYFDVDENEYDTDEDWID